MTIMGKGRLEAFSDGVFAILITIMVLELKSPAGDGWDALLPLLPSILGYVLSFLYLGIYWSNHHHMLHTAQHVSGGMLWANLHLLFWLSLVPFTTEWVGLHHTAPLPTALYGFVLLMAALAYAVLQWAILHTHGDGSLLARAIGRDLKGKLSLLGYLAAIVLSFLLGVGGAGDLRAGGARLAGAGPAHRADFRRSRPQARMSETHGNFSIFC